MFGTYIFDQASDIIEGHMKEITQQENELYEKRIAICKNCPLYTDKFGGICDGKKCWDKSKGLVVTYPGNNITCGCGCRLQAKTRLKGAKCVLGKW